MDIKIIDFQLKYLGEMAKSFVESFDEWDVKTASQYMKQAYLICPDYCFAAINGDGKVTGAIFCKFGPFGSGKTLIIESLQIKKEFRNKKIGSALIGAVVKRAKNNKVPNMSMLASNKKDFPLLWFKNIGFKETGWVELVGEVKKIKI